MLSNRFDKILEIFDTKILSSSLYSNLINYNSEDSKRNLLKIILLDFLINIEKKESAEKEEELWYNKINLKNEKQNILNFIDLIIDSILDNNSEISFEKLLTEILERINLPLKELISQLISILLYLEYEFNNIFQIIAKFIKQQFIESEEIGKIFNDIIIPKITKLINENGFNLEHKIKYPKQIDIVFFKILNEIFYLLFSKEQDQELIQSFINYTSIYDLLDKEIKIEVNNWLKNQIILEIKLNEKEVIFEKNNNNHLELNSKINEVDTNINLDIENNKYEININNNEKNNNKISLNHEEIENINKLNYQKPNLNFENLKLLKNSKNLEKLKFKKDYCESETLNKTISYLEMNNYMKLIYENERFIFHIESCISMIKKILSNFDFNSKKEIMLMKEKIEIQNIKIKRMEILIQFLKNPYLINLKRKIIEILMIQIIKENKEYIEISDNYIPNENLLEELKKKIKSKINEFKIGLNDYQLERLNNDLKYINNLKNNNKTNSSKITFLKKINDSSFHYKIKTTFKFLKFLRKELNPYVHISKSKSDYYLLPESCFNTNFEYNKYIYKIANLINHQIEREKKVIISEFNEKQIYLNKKELSLNNCWEILTCYSEEINNFFDEFDKEIQSYIELNQQIDMKYEKKYNILFNLYEYEKEKNEYISNFFTEEEIKILLEEVKEFQDNAISNFKEYYSYLISKEIPEKEEEIIKNNIKAYINNIININCKKLHLGFVNLKFQYEVNSILLKIIEFKRTIEELKINYENNMINQKIKNINELKEINIKVEEFRKKIQKEHSIESIIEMHKKWEKEINKKIYDFNNKKQYFSLNQIKSNLDELIKNNLILNIDFSFDEVFYIWLIKKDLINYFK